ncbi:MAG: class II aldolase/adducin family protein, partial [Planctomycetota bacterium]
MEYKEQREETAYFMRRLYEHKLTTCSGGNLSCLVDSDKIVITASATDKGRITADEVGIITFAGENLTPDLKPS